MKKLIYSLLLTLFLLPVCISAQNKNPLKSPPAKANGTTDTTTKKPIKSTYANYLDLYPEPKRPLLFSSYYPNFILFADEPAKFQISFKVNVMYRKDAKNDSGLYGAMSILSMWQLTDLDRPASCPFVDNNYMPEVFYLFDFRQNIPWFTFQVGFMHDSNGLGGDEYNNSVAYDQIYVEPQFHFHFWGGYLNIKLRVWIPVQIDDNPDLLEYIGIGQLNLSYKMVIHNLMGLEFDLMLRKGLSADAKGAVEFTTIFGPWFGKKVTVPIGIMFQVWYGYGESLGFYKECYFKFRAGISLALW